MLKDSTGFISEGLFLVPVDKVVATDVDVFEAIWETTAKDGVHREDASGVDHVVLVFELETRSSPGTVAGRRPGCGTDTGVLLDGELDRAPMVWPIAVVFPANWI